MADGSAGGTLHVSYGDWPSHAWLRTEHQLVLLKAGTGAIRAAAIQLAHAVLADVARLEAHINAGRAAGADQQDLKLRGICFEAHHASIVLHVELLHDQRVRPALTEQELWAAFFHAEVHYGDQFGMVQVTITTVDRHANGYDPLADHC